MGHLIYGVAPAIEIDDWTLQHLRMVIVTKLRRNESFTLTWGDDAPARAEDTPGESGRYGSVWISKSSSLYFSFDAPTDRPLNMRWLQILAEAAQGPTGLRPLPEPAAD